MTDRATFRLLLKAFGAIKEGEGEEALIQQAAALSQVREKIKSLQQEVEDKYRVISAQKDADKRIKFGEPGHGAHMRHCYGMSDEPWGQHERFTCKYGQDDICPAALYEDPWKEYLKMYPETG